MKKLLVVALSAIMVLSMAAVSMAATTVGGELNFGWYLGQPKTITETTDGSTSEMAESDTALDDFANAKLTVTADLTDSVQGFVAFKSSDNLDADFVDEAWFKYTQGWGNVSVGFFEFTTDGDADIIDDYSTNVKHHAGVGVTGKITDNISVTGYVAGDNVDTTATETDLEFYYAGGISYDSDTFGIQLLASTSSIDDAATITYVNTYYKLGTVAKLYFDYATSSDAAFTKPATAYTSTDTSTDPDTVTAVAAGKSEGSYGILGASFDTDKFYGRVEYQVLQLDDEDDASVDNSYGVRLGYKITNGTMVEVQTKAYEGADAQTYAKLKFVF